MSGEESVPGVASDKAAKATLDLLIMYHILIVQGIEPSDEFCTTLAGFRKMFMVREGGLEPQSDEEVVEMLRGIGEHLTSQAAILFMDRQMTTTSEGEDHGNSDG